MLRLASLLFVTLVTTGSARACDQAAIGRQIQATWTPRMEAAAGSACQIATVMINMLNDTRRRIRGCFPEGSQMAADADAELVGRIRRAEQTRRDAGC